MSWISGVNECLILKKNTHITRQRNFESIGIHQNLREDCLQLSVTLWHFNFNLWVQFQNLSTRCTIMNYIKKGTNNRMGRYLLLDSLKRLYCSGFQVHSANQAASTTKKLRFQLAKERKASTTLGIIMSAFIVCWLPFFVLALVRPFLRDSKAIPNSLSSIFLWLGYANSLLNPIIYATLNRDFRRPFQQILFFRCGSLNHMMREEFYHSQYGDPDPPQHFYMTGGSPEKTVVQNLKDVDDDIEIINSSSIKNSIQISKANESFLW